MKGELFKGPTYDPLIGEIHRNTHPVLCEHNFDDYFLKKIPV